MVWTAHLLAHVKRVYSFLTLPSYASEDSKVPGTMVRAALGVGAAALGLSDTLRPQ